MKPTIIILLVISASLHDVFGMTVTQLKKTMGVMKNQCMQKIGVPESKIKNIGQGDFLEDPDVKCYVACVYKTIQVTKNEKLNRDMINKQVDILYPPEMKEGAKASIDVCVDVQDNYSDFCDRVFYSAKCLYERDPANFIFP